MREIEIPSWVFLVNTFHIYSTSTEKIIVLKTHPELSYWGWCQSIILGTKKGFGDSQIGAISWRLQFDRVGVRDGYLPKGQATNINKDKKVSVSVVSSISGISSEDWDACSLDASGPEKFNPFLTHGFLSALEETGCAVQETGWVPQHIIARDDRNNILRVIPHYLKSC